MGLQEDARQRLHAELEAMQKRVSELQALVSHSLLSIRPADGQDSALSTPVHSPPEEILLPEILDSGPFGMAVMDFDFHFLRTNTTLANMLGRSREELRLLALPDVTYPEDINNCAHLVERVRRGAAPHDHIEKRLLMADGRILWVQLTVSLIRDQTQNPWCALAVVEDISERKHTAEQLRDANRKLASRVEELELRTQEMTWLGEMGDMLRSCLTTEETYAVIVRVAQRLFAVETGALYVVGASGDSVELVAAWGDASLIERDFAPGECWALRRGRVHCVEDPQPGFLCRHLSHAPPSGYLCIPLIAQSDSLGVLHLACRKGDMVTEAKQSLAFAMAEQIALALSNLKLSEAVRSQSIRDPLTGLLNRSFMEESLDLELHRAARYHRPLGVIVLDLDDFDALLQTLSRNSVDALLRDLGGLLHSQVRKEDLACRCGTHRFAVILPQGSLEATRDRAEALRQLILRMELKELEGLSARVTASIGVAAYPEHGRSIEELLGAADEALSHARAAGGNRVLEPARS